MFMLSLLLDCSTAALTAPMKVLSKTGQNMKLNFLTGLSSFCAMLPIILLQKKFHYILQIMSYRNKVITVINKEIKKRYIYFHCIF